MAINHITVTITVAINHITETIIMSINHITVTIIMATIHTRVATFTISHIGADTIMITVKQGREHLATLNSTELRCSINQRYSHPEGSILIPHMLHVTGANYKAITPTLVRIHLYSTMQPISHSRSSLL